MDFLDEGEIEKIIEVDAEEVKADIAGLGEPGSASLDRETNADKHEAYMKLNKDVILFVARAVFLPDSAEAIQAAGYSRSLNISEIRSADAKKPLNVIATDTGLTYGWLKDQVQSGWNSGKGCGSFWELNQLSAYNSQLEFVPFKDGDNNLFFCHKVRYDSVAYLPHHDGMLLLSNFYRLNAAGLVYIDIPSNLHAALDAAKSSWAPGAIAKAFLKGAIGYFPTVNNVAGLSYILGRNLDTLKTKVFAIDPNIALSIMPLVKDKSIFAGKVLPQWASFFAGFSHDNVGPVSAARALASLCFDAYYGQLGDIGLWLCQPTVLKVPKPQTGIVKHTYIDFESTIDWAANMCVYNPTPEELNAVIACAGSPAALAMPLTSVITNNPQVTNYCGRHLFMDVLVLCSDPPLVVFRPGTAETGIDGRSMPTNLLNMEKAIVKGFLECLRRKADPDNYRTEDCVLFRIAPANDYSVVKFSVNVVFEKLQYSTSCMRYVSMNDAERRRYIPTSRMTDVHIDGVSLVPKTPLAMLPQYPRWIWRTLRFPQPLDVGHAYNLEMEDSGPYNVDIDNWTDKAGIQIVPVVNSFKFAKEGNARM